MKKILLFLMSFLFVLAIGVKHADAVPDIRGEYSGSYTIAVSNCMDLESNGTYYAILKMSISAQTGNTFTGTATGTFDLDGLTATEYIQLSGTINDSGQISGTSSHTFLGTGGEGTFTGQLKGNTLSIENPGHDTYGDTCSYIRYMTATKCFAVAVAVLRGGPHTIPPATEPHNVVLSNMRTLALATGNGRVTAEVFDAILGNPQTSRVEDWLNSLNEDCAEPIAAVLVGHSLGGEGAIDVNYKNVCSRILLDEFDPSLLPLFNQSQASPREAPTDGYVYSFLAEFPKTFQGRPLMTMNNVDQQCVEGTDHNSIVISVLGSGPFQDTILGREIIRCGSANPPPTVGRDVRCTSHATSISDILLLLLGPD